MTRRVRDVLPPSTAEERRCAGEAARALRAAVADPSSMGVPSTMHVDLARPRRGEWHTTWSNLPGLVRVNGRFRHAGLPGWEYARAEVRAEMIPDLEALAERGERPTQASGPTRPATDAATPGARDPCSGPPSASDRFAPPTQMELPS